MHNRGVSAYCWCLGTHRNGTGTSLALPQPTHHLLQSCKMLQLHICSSSKLHHKKHPSASWCRIHFWMKCIQSHVHLRYPLSLLLQFRFSSACYKLHCLGQWTSKLININLAGSLGIRGWSMKTNCTGLLRGRLVAVLGHQRLVGLVFKDAGWRADDLFSMQGRWTTFFMTNSSRLPDLQALAAVCGGCWRK